MRYLLLIVLIFGSEKSFSQMEEVKAKLPTEHSLYFELGGNAFFYSLNYLQRRVKSDSLKISYRLGLSHVPSSEYVVETATLVPVEVAFEANPNFKGLEYGLGLTYAHLNDEDGTYMFCYVIPKIGYRHEFKSGNSFLRIAITPIVPIPIYTSIKLDEDPPLFFPWFGAGIGRKIN